jgi:hypothetical protein
MHIRDIQKRVVYEYISAQRVRLITDVLSYLNAPYRVSYYGLGRLAVEHYPKGYKNAWRLKDVDWRY